MKKPEIVLITVGKLKEDYLKAAQKDLVLRIEKTRRIRVIEVPDEKSGENASLKEMEKVKYIEGQGIIRQLDLRGRIVIMDIQGKKTTSVMMKTLLLSEWEEEEKIQFVIGGSLGLTADVLSLAHKRISFGEMTYPHQLFRIMLLDTLSTSV